MKERRPIVQSKKSVNAWRRFLNAGSSSWAGSVVLLKTTQNWIRPPQPLHAFSIRVVNHLNPIPIFRNQPTKWNFGQYAGLGWLELYTTLFSSVTNISRRVLGDKTSRSKSWLLFWRGKLVASSFARFKERPARNKTEMDTLQMPQLRFLLSALGSPIIHFTNYC